MIDGFFIRELSLPYLLIIHLIVLGGFDLVIESFVNLPAPPDHHPQDLVLVRLGQILFPLHESDLPSGVQLFPQPVDHIIEFIDLLHLVLNHRLIVPKLPFQLRDLLRQLDSRRDNDPTPF